MKKGYWFYIFILLACTCVNLQAQKFQQASATGHITAEIIDNFTAIETSQMNFGPFAPGSYGGQIILTPESTVSVIGSVIKGIGSYNAASFFISGDNSTTFSITLPESPVTLVNAINAKTIKVSNWVSLPSSTPGAEILRSGNKTVYVGATLEVGTLENNPVGIYEGSYTIMFDFN
ncbi:MAG: DUF4402 domain-containing protein [Mariniphaga sp.]|nr:DUF4402 domain-containing protein [Mariniphaga sp.]